MERKRLCLSIKCDECGKKLGLFKAYKHPVDGRKKCVCESCWEKIDKSEKTYTNFILESVNKKYRGTSCYIMIKTFPKYEKDVYDSLLKLSQIEEAFALFGTHDIIVKIQFESYEKLNNFILKDIRTINGIKKTNTLTGTFSLIGSNDINY